MLLHKQLLLQGGEVLHGQERKVLESLLLGSSNLGNGLLDLPGLGIGGQVRERDALDIASDADP